MNFEDKVYLFTRFFLSEILKKNFPDGFVHESLFRQLFQDIEPFTNSKRFHPAKVIFEIADQNKSGVFLLVA